MSRLIVGLVFMITLVVLVLAFTDSGTYHPSPDVTYSPMPDLPKPVMPSDLPE